MSMKISQKQSLPSQLMLGLNVHVQDINAPVVHQNAFCQGFEGSTISAAARGRGRCGF
jgi:hypothetical protein